MNRTIVNIACSILVLITNVAINLVLSPIIVKTIGAEANGFVTLANNCVTYAQLLTTALNSMASRFITIEYTRKNYSKANLYYNSIFWGTFVLTLILTVLSIFCIVRLEFIFDVPSDILSDVKLLFTFIFVNFLVTTILPKYDCGPYAVNRLDRSYIPQAVGQIARCVVVFSLFAIFIPHVWYVGLAASIMTIIVLAANAYNTHVLTPELQISLRKDKRLFSFKALSELLFSGIWNSIQSVGTMLLSGMDILITNMLLGASAMGMMSLSKTLYTLVQQLSTSLCNALAPELVIDWAKKDSKKLLKNIERAMAMTSCIMTIPLAGIMVFGDWFYELWVPSENSNLLWSLTILSILGYVFTSGTQILYNVFTTVNKVRPNAVAVLVSGIASIAVTLILVRTTSLGIYAVAGVSTAANLIRNLTFTLPSTARYLGCKWYCFYPQVAKTSAATAILVTIGFTVKTFGSGATWLLFIASITAFTAIGFVFNILFLLSAEDRHFLKRKIADKIKK